MVKKLKDLQNKKGKKGFSMIELIIVIAIMAILVALIGTQLIPYLEKSRTGRDRATMDTILTAAQTVVADHELTITDAEKVSEIIGSDEEIKKEFEKYAGLALDDKPFKAKDFKDSEVGNVQFEVKDDVIESAYIENGDKELKVQRDRTK